MEKEKEIELLSRLMKVLEGVSIEDAKDLLYALDKFIINSQTIKDTENCEQLLSVFLN